MPPPPLLIPLSSVTTIYDVTAQAGALAHHSERQHSQEPTASLSLPVLISQKHEMVEQHVYF